MKGAAPTWQAQLLPLKPNTGAQLITQNLRKKLQHRNQVINCFWLPSFSLLITNQLNLDSHSSAWGTQDLSMKDAWHVGKATRGRILSSLMTVKAQGANLLFLICRRNVVKMTLPSSQGCSSTQRVRYFINFIRWSYVMLQLLRLQCSGPKAELVYRLRECKSFLV